MSRVFKNRSLVVEEQLEPRKLLCPVWRVRPFSDQLSLFVSSPSLSLELVASLGPYDQSQAGSLCVPIFAPILWMWSDLWLLKSCPWVLLDSCWDSCCRESAEGDVGASVTRVCESPPPGPETKLMGLPRGQNWVWTVRLRGQLAVRSGSRCGAPAVVFWPKGCVGSGGLHGSTVGGRREGEPRRGGGANAQWLAQRRGQTDSSWTSKFIFRYFFLMVNLK